MYMVPDVQNMMRQEYKNNVPKVTNSVTYNCKISAVFLIDIESFIIKEIA